MGMPASKFGQEIEQEEPTQGSLPSTPILTPKTRLSNLDPRSPSENIVRTPIQIFLEKNRPTLSTENNESLSEENNSDTFNIYSPGIKLKNIDPRSPTVEFVRTPITIPHKESLPIKLHNKNLDNVRKSLMNSPFTKSKGLINDNIESGSEKITTPKLLESVLITPKPNENKRLSYVGLLETNLDYVETDLDMVKCNDIKENIEESSTNDEILQPQTTDVSTPIKDRQQTIPDVDPRSPSTDFIRTPLQIVQKLENLDIEDKFEDNSVQTNDYATQIFSYCDEDGLKTIISHKTIETAQSPHNVKTNDNHTHELKAENLEDFDKKLTNLIYEDKEISECVIRNRRISQQKSRTPLGIRNSNTDPKKAVISKLKVHDKPQKKNNESSRIPIFQNKKKGKFAQQCENTPPLLTTSNKNDIRKIGKWDPNNTLII